MTEAEKQEEGRRLARQCLSTFLPPDDLYISGLALIEMVATWLSAVPEEGRPAVYMEWLRLLHVDFIKNDVLMIKAVVEEPNEPSHSPDTMH